MKMNVNFNRQQSGHTYLLLFNLDCLEHVQIELDVNTALHCITSNFRLSHVMLLTQVVCIMYLGTYYCQEIDLNILRHHHNSHILIISVIIVIMET